MSRLAIVFLAVVTLASFAFAADAPSPRATLNFNPGWRLFVGDPAGAQEPAFDDTAWKPVTLPHAWNEDAAFRVAIDQHPTGIAWYRKTFKLPPESAGKKVFLEFEGVRQAGEFWLNGQRVGLHENGIMAFGFDVTDYVKPAPDTNVLAVRTDNDWAYREKLSGSRFQWSDKNFNANFGGLSKNCRPLTTADARAVMLSRGASVYFPPSNCATTRPSGSVSATR